MADEELVVTDENGREYWRNFALFMLMGAGANFVLPTALVQQVPYFEEHLPEGECIATYMNLFTSLGLLTMLLYLYINSVRKVPYSLSVPGMLVVSSATSFLAALTYHVTAGDVSVFLYLCCFIGGSVGALSSVIMNPFMTAYRNNNISAARAGGSGFVLLCALVATAQQVGSDRQQFSAAAYLCIIGALLSLSIPAYCIITWGSLGLRKQDDYEDSDLKTERTEGTQGTAGTTMQGQVGNPMIGVSMDKAKTISAFDIEKSDSAGAGAVMDMDMGYGGGDKGDKDVGTGMGMGMSAGTGMGTGVSGTVLLGLDTAPLMDYVLTLVPPQTHSEHPWLRKALPYMLVVGWINFNTWGILSAIIPFAVSHAFRSDSAGDLGIALQVGAVLLVLGDLSTTLCKINILKGCLLFSLCCLLLYIAALARVHSSAAGPLVVILFSLARFLEAHLVTTCLRAIATHFPPAQRETASRTLGVANQLCTTAGALFATLIVYLLFQC